MKGRFSIESLLVCAAVNGVLLWLCAMGAREVLSGLERWVEPLLASGGLPENARLAAEGLSGLLREAGARLHLWLFGAGAVATLLLWFLVQLRGRALAGRVRASCAGSAVEILKALQLRGGLLDFLKSPNSRPVLPETDRAACAAALAEFFDLAPALDAPLGATVKVARGDAGAVALTGKPDAAPPCEGVLAYRGWRVTGVRLPPGRPARPEVIAPAVVEVGEEPAARSEPPCPPGAPPG